MARGERNARNQDREPAIDPYFGLTGGPSGYADFPGPKPFSGGPLEQAPGYSQPSMVDSAGYTLADPELDQRVGASMPDDVTAPLGGPRFGARLAFSSYDDPFNRPVPGGALGEAGAVWDRADYGGIGVPFGPGEYLAPQHALRPAPVEYGRDSGVSEPHAEPGRETGLGRIPRPEPAPGRKEPGYFGGLADRRNLSDREVYDDLYGSGREFGLDEGGDRGVLRTED